MVTLWLNQMCMYHFCMGIHEWFKHEWPKQSVLWVTVHLQKIWSVLIFLNFCWFLLLLLFTFLLIQVMNEILHGIRVIKFYAWEKNFEEKVTELR